MRVTVRWESRVEHTLVADVDLDALASWAIQSQAIGLLVDGVTRIPQPDELAASLTLNPHLCARLVQLHAVATRTPTDDAE